MYVISPLRSQPWDLFPGSVPLFCRWPRVPTGGQAPHLHSLSPRSPWGFSSHSVLLRLLYTDPNVNVTPFLWISHPVFSLCCKISKVQLSGTLSWWLGGDWHTPCRCPSCHPPCQTPFPPLLSALLAPLTPLLPPHPGLPSASRPQLRPLLRQATWPFRNVDRFAGPLKIAFSRFSTHTPSFSKCMKREVIH